MTTTVIALIVSNLLFLLLLSISVYFNVKHGILIIKISEAIEETLDIIDEKYDSISKVLEIPLFYDSPQVRGVLEDVRRCRESLLESANILTEVSREEDEEKKNN